MAVKFSQFISKKTNTFLKDKDVILGLLKDWEITSNPYDFKIGDDGVVDVFCGVELQETLKNSYEKLPFRFGEVQGIFNLSGNHLKILEGSPHTVNGSFVCSDNDLTSLEGSPKIVKGRFVCSKNPIRTLKGVENLQGLEGIFSCQGTKIDTLEYAPKCVTKMNVYKCARLTSLHDIHKHLPNLREIHLNPEYIKSHVLGLLMIKDLHTIWNSLNHEEFDKYPWIKIVLKYYGAGQAMDNKRILECQNELLDAGLDEYAQT